MVTRLVFCLAIGLLIGGSLDAPIAYGDDFAALQPQLQKALETFVSESGLPGATAALVRDDGTELQLSAGYADRELGIVMEPETLMLAASIGKTYASAIALALASERQVDLDAHINKWLGKKPWFLRLPNGPEITLRMLLNQTSGLPEPYNARFKPEFQNNPLHLFTPDEMVEFVLDQKPLFKAGTGYEYSDINYILVGMIIEDVTGRPYYDLLKEQILTPLKLSHTVPNAVRIPGLAAGYWNPDKNLVGLHTHKAMSNGSLLYDPRFEWQGGGVAATAGDLARWAVALYRGKAMPRAYLDELFASVPSHGVSFKENDYRYGLGVEIRRTRYGKAYGHTGSIPGYDSMMFYFPDCHVAVAIEVNYGQGRYDQLLTIEDRLLRPYNDTMKGFQCRFPQEGK